MIKTVGLLISQYHQEESLIIARTHIEELGLSCFTDLSFLNDNACDFNKDSLFVFTDDRDTADRITDAGIGFAVYENEKSRSSSFTEALYVIERISDLSLMLIERMLLRHLHLPWTILETERCIVREITVDDVDRLYEIYGENAEAFQYAGALYEDPAEEKAYTRDYIDHQYRFREHGIWIVTDKASGQIIGRAGLDNREGYEDAELGYVFAIAFRHKGYAYEVCSAIVEYAANTLGMERLNAFTIRENTDSVRLLKRLGFVFEETVSLNGEKHDRYRKILYNESVK